MNVEICTDPARWDAFVESHPEGSNYHRWVWKEVVERTYGHRAYYLAAADRGSIEGVLPLFRMKSWLFGHFLTSVPFFSYGGPIARTGPARRALLDRAVELAQELGARHIELRCVSRCDSGGDWQCHSPKVTMILRLPESSKCYVERLSSKMRQRIRFSVKHGLRAEWAGIDSVDDFYRVFSINMRHLGTPVYPRQWFANICRRLGDQVRILAIRDGRETVAAGIITQYRDGVEIPWSGSLPAARDRQPVVLMFWTLIEWAISQGYKFADFGRCTRGGGVYQFKQLWLCEEHPLHWYYWLPAGSSVPELRPDNPRFRAATRLWQRLPLPVANRLGPMIVRSIP